MSWTTEGVAYTSPLVGKNHLIVKRLTESRVSVFSAGLNRVPWAGPPELLRGSSRRRSEWFFAFGWSRKGSIPLPKRRWIQQPFTLQTEPRLRRFRCLRTRKDARRF